MVEENSFFTINWLDICSSVIIANISAIKLTLFINNFTNIFYYSNVQISISCHRINAQHCTKHHLLAPAVVLHFLTGGEVTIAAVCVLAKRTTNVIARPGPVALANIIKYFAIICA